MLLPYYPMGKIHYGLPHKWDIPILNSLQKHMGNEFLITPKMVDINAKIIGVNSYKGKLIVRILI
jgi:hypothetical protein